ncbi:hypothetical protein [Lacinutrix cladophorae]
MKNLKNVVSVISLTLILLISFSVKAQENEYSKEQIEDVKTKLRQGMNTFVEKVKPFYKKGMSYTDFKNVLIGENNKNISKQGDELLSKSYLYLSKNVDSKQILNSDSGEEFAKAYLFVNDYNKTSKRQNGDLVLFGNPTGDTYPDFNSTKTAAPCKWYQLSCWMVQIFGDYAEDIIFLLLNFLFP